MSASRKLRGFCISMALRSWNKWHSSHVDCRAGLAALAREHCTRMCQREKIAAAAASCYWICDLNIFESKRWYVIWARVPPEKKRHNARVENASFRFPPPHRSLVYMAAASGLREAHRTRGAHWTSRASWSVIQALESSVKLEAQDASVWGLS